MKKNLKKFKGEMKEWKHWKYLQDHTDFDTEWVYIWKNRQKSTDKADFLKSEI